MIAKNYLRCAAAMALQMPLPLGRPVWNGSRPTTRAGRAMRTIRAAAFKLAGRVRYPVKVTTPAWYKEARAKAIKLAQAVREACLGLAV